MPYLDQLFEKKGLPALGGPQCYEGRVVATSPQGAYVVLPNFDRFLRWGPCQPPDAGVALGDEVSITLSEDGVPWLIGVKGGGAVGPPGPEGPTGPSGPSGPTGPSGPKGDPGTAGQAGAQGPTGPIGPQGPNGATGATGAQGPKGDKGDTGATGPSGAVEIAFRNGGWGDTSSPGVNVWTNVSIKSTGTPGTITPAGAFIENADGSLSVRDAGWYDIEVAVAFTAAGIHTLSVGPSPAAQNYQVMASTSGGGGQLTGAAAMPLAAGAKLYLTQNSNIAGQVQMVTFTVTKVGAGPKGDVGAQGAAGAQGPQGTQGVKGDTGAQGPVGATGPAGPIVEYSTSMTRVSGAAVAIPGAAFTKVPLDQTNYDSAGNADAANGRVTIRTAGRYHITANGYVNSSASGASSVGAAIFINGGNAQQEQVNAVASSVVDLTPSLTVSLVVGDQIELRVYSNIAGATYQYNSNVNNLAVDRIGAGPKGDPGAPGAPGAQGIGGLLFVTKAASYVANPNEYVQFTGGGGTITLPNAPPNNTRVAVYTTQGPVTVACQGTDSFGWGSFATTSLGIRQGGMATFQCVGGYWYVTDDQGADLTPRRSAANYTANPGEYVANSHASASITVTLPSGDGAGFHGAPVGIYGGVGGVVVQRGGADTITARGQTGLTTYNVLPGQSARFIRDAALGGGTPLWYLESTTAPPLQWLNLSPYYNATYWTDYVTAPPGGGGFTRAQFCKTAEGIVRFRGLIKSVSGYAWATTASLTICTLPLGYRPTDVAMAMIPQVDNANAPSLMRVDLTSDGRVAIANSGASASGAGSGGWTGATNTGIVQYAPLDLISFATP